MIGPQMWIKSDGPNVFGLAFGLSEVRSSDLARIQPKNCSKIGHFWEGSSKFNFYQKGKYLISQSMENLDLTQH